MIFLNQDLFTNLLSFERKRSERTGQPFGLALLDVTHVPNILTLCNALASQMRETDLAGWYRQEAVAGIIFTSLNGTPSAQIRSRLLAKITEVIGSVLSKEDQDKIQVTLRLFPEDVYEEFYPDLAKFNDKKTYHNTKRVIDILFSLTTLILLSPLLLVITILIKISSNGPVLFRQKRMGMFRKEFDFLKFRSMLVNNNSSIHEEYVSDLIQNKNTDSSGVFKIKQDPRVTPIGRFLRRTSLDELPQFWNVLKGEMSLVGPRPPIPYEMKLYYPWHRRRVFEVKPGITGLWQVNGRSRTTFDQMVRLDIQYIRQQSMWLDIKICLKTPFAMISGKGAY